MFSTKTSAPILSIISNFTLTILKVIVGIFTGSVSVLAEGIHSATDLLASLMAFFSIRAAAKPADAHHQFGHGKIENFSGTIEGLLIFAAAGYIIYEAIQKIQTGVEIVSLNLGIGVMGFAALVNFLVSRHLLRVAKKEDSVALEADAWHLRTDVYTSLGVFAGLIAVRLTEITLLDPIIAIAMALLIIRAAYQITRKAVLDLLDVSLPENEINTITDIVNGHLGEIAGFTDLRTRKSGGERFIHLTLIMPYDAVLSQTHALCVRIETEIGQKLPNCNIVIHCDPCTFAETGVCAPDCPAAGKACQPDSPAGTGDNQLFRHGSKGRASHRGGRRRDASR
jgi:cation diffusion facilitator family transporter